MCIFTTLLPVTVRAKSISAAALGFWALVTHTLKIAHERGFSRLIMEVRWLLSLAVVCLAASSALGNLEVPDNSGVIELGSQADVVLYRASNGVLGTNGTFSIAGSADGVPVIAQTLVLTGNLTVGTGGSAINVLAEFEALAGNAPRAIDQL